MKEGKRSHKTKGCAQDWLSRAVDDRDHGDTLEAKPAGREKTRCRGFPSRGEIMTEFGAAVVLFPSLALLHCTLGSVGMRSSAARKQTLPRKPKPGSRPRPTWF